MLTKDIINILEKYQENNKREIQAINTNILEISSQLAFIRENLAKYMSELITNDKFDDVNEIMKDSKCLLEYINSVSKVNIKETTIYQTEIAEEITPIFTKKVYPYLVSDDICPFCNVKFVQHYIYYQRIRDDKIHDESVIWYRCPACNKLFVIDYEADDFDFDNTNIFLNKDKYNEIPSINIYTLIVLSNTLKCSSNHDTKDIIAKLPVLNEYGQISYISVNASYCPNCNRYTILKEDFNAIAGIVTCKVIDETASYDGSSESDIEINTKQSILAQYGYNVQTKKDLSEQQRHIILSSIIEAQIMTRREVIDHISTLIERGSKIPNWKFATQKWKEDRQFVSDYQSDCLPEVVFNNIILKYRKPK